MDAEQIIFADDIDACPKCGSTEFWESWVIKIGGDPTDAEFASINCKKCGASFYGRDYYRRHFGKLKTDDDEEIPF